LALNPPRASSERRRVLGNTTPAFWRTSSASVAHICIASGGRHLKSQWALSGAFEEITVPSFILKEGDNGWGMLAQRGIAKPQFNTYKLLHRLDDRRLQASGPALASRSKDGAAVLVWNLADVQQPSGIPGLSSERKVSGSAKRIEVTFRGARAGQRVKVSYVDQERGSPFPTWRELGSPRYPRVSRLYSRGSRDRTAGDAQTE
jgi:xylan 1,4-beta-xylosidase